MTGKIEFKRHQLGDKQFEYLRELIYKEAGINLTDAKRCLVETRIGKLMRKNNIDNYEALFRLLETDTSGDFLVLVLDSISTNHTFFFREDAHFTYLTETIIPFLVKNLGRKHIRIWSAACSSGEEPYTIAISLHELQNSYPYLDFEILATDLSTKVLSNANSGVYPIDVIEKIPTPLRKKYFQRGKDDKFNLVKVKDFIRSKVTFMRHNLLYPLPGSEKFDIVFCRNVMIYFDYVIKEKVVKNIYENVADEGFFITGHSESLSVIRHPFVTEKPTIYRKAKEVSIKA